MAWRLARSLQQLESEIKNRYPGTTVWDIGDQSHASGWSDHNPNSRGVVCAIDVLNDGGMDLDWFANAVRTCGHPDLDYVIWQDQIADAGGDWQDYGGSYHGHVHVSVGNGPDGRSTGGYGSTRSWGLGSGGSVPSLSRIARPTLHPNDHEPEVGKLQRNLNEALGLRLVVDNRYGPNTTAGVRLLQERAGIDKDGIYGDDSAAALRTLLEDDMNLDDKLTVTDWTKDRWGRSALDVGTALSHAYTYSRNASDYASAARVEQAKQTALLEKVLAGQSGLDEEAIAAAVADGVRAAIDPAELAAAIAAGLDAELDLATAERAVEAALRNVLGGLDGPGE